MGACASRVGIAHCGVLLLGVRCCVHVIAVWKQTEAESFAEIVCVLNSLVEVNLITVRAELLR